MKKCEVLLEEKNRLANTTIPKEVGNRKKIEKNIENLLDEMNIDVNQMETELSTQRKKPELYHNLNTKQEIIELLKKKIELLRNKYEDVDYNENDYSINENALQQLDRILSSQHGGADRELYVEEQNKINQWNERVKGQDEKLEDIHRNVKILRNQVDLAGEGIDNVGLKVKNLNEHTDKTHKNLDTQNSRLKELIAKYRSGDKFCCDIILVFLIIGLVCSLYSVIKHKFD